MRRSKAVVDWLEGEEIGKERSVWHVGGATDELAGVHIVRGACGERKVWGVDGARAVTVACVDGTHVLTVAGVHGA